MFVGQNPGGDELREHRPFVGRSGKLLRTELAKQGFKDVFITNTVRCGTEGDRAPTPQEIKACREYLDYEIARVKPKFVVALGATAAKALFTGKSKVTQFHGTIVEDPKKPYKGYIAYHPAYILRDMSKLREFTADLARLKRAVNGELRKSTVNWRLVRRGNLKQFLHEFAAAHEFAFDIESVGPPPLHGLFPFRKGFAITALSIALPERTWVVPCMDYDPILKRRKYTPWRRGDAFTTLVRTLVRIQHETQKKGISQNGKYDDTCLKVTTGASFRNSFDTMLASHVLDENTDHDLKSLVRANLDEPEYDVTRREKMGHVHPRNLYRYGAHDAAYTLRLKSIFNRQVCEEPDLKRLFYKLVMPVARAMERVELVGKTVNLEKWDETTLDIHSQIVQLERSMNKNAGRTINWNSPDQVGALLYGKLKLPCKIKTPKGKNSTSEEALFDLKGRHPLADQLLDFREKSKFLGTYLRGLRENMVGNTLYISYKIHGTVGGRFSARIHSIPRDGSIRNLIEAPPGWKFFVADISQAELRIAAHFSHDGEMRRCFTEGIDIHWRTLMHAIGTGAIGEREYVEKAFETAVKLSGIRESEMSLADACEIMLKAGHKACTEVWYGWKEGRYRAKCLNFGFLYGMYENKFIELAKSDYNFEPTFDEAHAMREGFFGLYSGLPDWHEREKTLARMNGYARILTGRRRHLPAIMSSNKWERMEAERQAVNIRVQGFIGDYKSMALVEIDDTVVDENCKIVGEHHDAVLGIIRDGAEDDYLPRIREIMRHPRLLDEFNIKLSIPMASDIEVGAWGVGVVYHDPKERKAA